MLESVWTGENALTMPDAIAKLLYPCLGSDGCPQSCGQNRPLLVSVRKQAKPRTVDLYEVFCSVRYLFQSGSQCRMQPSDFPKWRAGHAYFAKWSKPCPG